MSWWDDAACRGTPDVDFFAKDPGPALAVCGGCAVRGRCAAWALQMAIPVGVFGGLTPQERRKGRRSMREQRQAEFAARVGQAPAEEDKHRLNSLARAKAVKELMRRHHDEFVSLYAAEKQAVGLEGRVRPRRTA